MTRVYQYTEDPKPGRSRPSPAAPGAIASGSSVSDGFATATCIARCRLCHEVLAEYHHVAAAEAPRIARAIAIWTLCRYIGHNNFEDPRRLEIQWVEERSEERAT